MMSNAAKSRYGLRAASLDKTQHGAS